MSRGGTVGLSVEGCWAGRLRQEEEGRLDIRTESEDMKLDGVREEEGWFCGGPWGEEPADFGQSSAKHQQERPSCKITALIFILFHLNALHLMGNLPNSSYMLEYTK